MGHDTSVATQMFLLSTCRVQRIDPYTYLVDVLQRIDTHLAKDVELLTPRLWKKAFGENPLRSITYDFFRTFERREVAPDLV